MVFQSLQQVIKQHAINIVKPAQWLMVAISLLIVSCASKQSYEVKKQLTPIFLEPRVSFLDQKVTKINQSKIDPIKIEQVMASYQRLLGRGDLQIKSEALHRLADLTMRLAETKLAIDESEDKEVASTLAIKNASFSQAIDYYRQLLNEFPEYADIDRVKYQLARAHSLNADPESSLTILDQIAVKHQSSESLVETEFRRGESYFVRKQYSTAEKAYSQVLGKDQSGNFYDKALYKRGWSLFKQHLFLEAKSDFFKLYERLLEQKSLDISTSKSQMLDNLLTDTRRVISLTFYNMDGALSIKEHFSVNRHKNYENQIYTALASLYIEQERFQDAVDTYQQYILVNPLSLSSPDFNSRIIEIYQQGGFPSLILPAKEDFVTRYGNSSHFWQQHETTTHDKIRPLLLKHLKDVSTFYHAKAQKSKKASDYRVAAKWYAEILGVVIEKQQDSKYRFLLAETLFEGKKYRLSATEYEVVAYQNTSSEYSRDAGYRALVAWQELNKLSKVDDESNLVTSIKSGLRFAESFAEDIKTPEILARVAEQQLLIKQVAPAIKTSRQLLSLSVHPTLNQRSRAKIIIANGLFDLSHYAEAETAINELLETVKLTKKQRVTFRERRVAAIFKLAEEAKLKKNNQLAVDLFLKVKQLEPRSKIAINAHYDAATLLLSLQSWDKAESLLISFRKLYPQHQLTESIAEKLAFIYEKQKNWNKAAAEYSLLASKQTNTELAREGYWQVAELYLKASNKKQAVKAFKHYVWTYPQPYLLAQEGRNHLVNLYQQIGDSTKSYFWQRKIIQFFHKNKEKNNQRTQFLSAQSKFTLSEQLFNTFKKIKLKLPLAVNLKKKRAAMKKALDAYNAIAQYNVTQFTTASTHRVARIYQILSQDLLLSQKPKNLNEEELEEYGYLLEEQALPFEDKAIYFFEVNANRVVNNIYDDSVKASFEQLKALKPAQYDKKERLEGITNVLF